MPGVGAQFKLEFLFLRHVKKLRAAGKPFNPLPAGGHEEPLKGIAQDTKRWWRQLKNEGVLKLLANSKKRKARYVSLIGCFFGPGSYVVGKSEINGRIADEAKSSENSEQRFPKTNPWFFHQIFVPEGYSKQLSLLNQQDFTIIDYRRKALEDLLVNVKEEIIKSGEQTEINFNG